MTETTNSVLEFLFNELDRNITKLAELIQASSSDIICWLAKTETIDDVSKDKIERAYRHYMDRQELCA